MFLSKCKLFRYHRHNNDRMWSLLHSVNIKDLSIWLPSATMLKRYLPFFFINIKYKRPTLIFIKHCRKENCSRRLAAISSNDFLRSLCLEYKTCILASTSAFLPTDTPSWVMREEGSVFKDTLPSNSMEKKPLAAGQAYHGWISSWLGAEIQRAGRLCLWRLAFHQRISLCKAALPHRLSPRPS